jgi:hypothetical protein
MASKLIKSLLLLAAAISFCFAMPVNALNCLLFGLFFIAIYLVKTDNLLSAPIGFFLLCFLVMQMLFGDLMKFYSFIGLHKLAYHNNYNLALILSILSLLVFNLLSFKKLFFQSQMNSGY